MNIKKKIIVGAAASLFAVATMFNMGMLNENGAGDVSLDAIAVMAEAQSEPGTNCINCQTVWETCPDGKDVIRCRPDGDKCFVSWQEPC